MVNRRRLGISLAIFALLFGIASLYQPPAAAQESSCCEYASSCPGNYDICCQVRGSNCSPLQPKQCIQATACP